jgi:hypothetical protein
MQRDDRDDPYDDQLDEPEPDAAELRQVMRQVSAYRAICQQIRNKSNGMIFFGLFMIGIWYFLDGRRNNWDIFSILYLSLGLLELSVGLLNRLWPSPEGILLDGVVMFGFAASNGVRQYLAFQAFGQAAINPVMLVFAALWFFQGLQTIRSYFAIKKLMPIRPTKANLRWFDGLVQELRDADPKEDPRALSLPTEPFLTGKLLGDNAFFLDPSQTVLVASRRDVELVPARSEEEGRPFVRLFIDGEDFPPFRVSEANWSNYVAWKREGGEEPPPLEPVVPTVFPVRT